MYKIILHATDLAEDHYKMCQQAAKIAQHFQANLYLLHVVETPSSMVLAQGLGFAEIADPHPQLANAEAVLSIVGESLKIPKKRLLVEIGASQELIFATAKKLKAQLIIVGHHSPTNFLRTIGSSVLDEAQCDVLTLS